LTNSKVFGRGGGGGGKKRKKNLHTPELGVSLNCKRDWKNRLRGRGLLGRRGGGIQQKEEVLSG